MYIQFPFHCHMIVQLKERWCSRLYYVKPDYMIWKFPIIYILYFFSVKNVQHYPIAFLLANEIEANHYVSSQNFTAVDWLLTNKPHYFGLIEGWANPTGVFLLVVLLVMYVCSMKWVRKGGYFEVISNNFRQVWTS